MTDPLEKFEAYGFSEVYDVVRTVEVVMNDETYRVIVLRSYTRKNMPYTTRCEIQKDLVTGEGTAWVAYDLAWTADNTADGALEQALGFLSDDGRRKASR
jgi:hypothetical protein